MTTTEQQAGAVIVTGASRGIGAAIAERLADDGYGVIVNYSADADAQPAGPDGPARRDRRPCRG